MLFGDDAIEGIRDRNPTGSAEAFRFADKVAGTARFVNVYLPAGHSAKTLVAGLYTDAAGHPGSLLRLRLHRVTPFRRVGQGLHQVRPDGRGPVLLGGAAG